MDLLTRQEAAQYLRLSLRKLDDLTLEGKIRRIKIGEGRRGRVLFRRQDLDAFVEQHLSVEDSEIRRQAVETVRGRA